MAKGNLSLIQNQQMRISPQMLRAMQVLRLPLLDLLQSVREELDSNPALELLEDPSADLLPTGDPAPPSDDSVEIAYQEVAKPKAQKEPATIQISRPESLHEHLLWQLRLEELSPLEFHVGEQIIENLDEDGFHISDPLSFFGEEEQSVLDNMLLLIRAFDPVGTAVGNFQESLLTQAGLQDAVPPMFPQLITELFGPEGERHDLAHLTIPEPMLTQCLNFLKTLTPFPGRQYSTEELQYVIPDATVTGVDNEIIVLPNTRYLPRLGINSFFEKSTKDRSSEVKQFAKQQVNKAKEFLQSLALRETSTEKVLGIVATVQAEFFRKGPRFLEPLTMKQVAEKTKLSESTVSRVVNGRYVQTDWGVFLLRYFFSSAGVRQQNAKIHPEKIREYIVELLAEDGKLSDQKISERLQEKGVAIARRTVAKYRREWGLARSQVRK